MKNIFSLKSLDPNRSNKIYNLKSEKHCFSFCVYEQQYRYKEKHRVGKVEPHCVLCCFSGDCRWVNNLNV